MNRRTERLADLLPAVVADLAARHTTNGAAMVRVHINPEITMQPCDIAEGGRWEITEIGTLRVLSGLNQPLAEFAADTWTHVERVQRGAA